MEEGWIGIKEAADLMGISITTAHAWAKKGVIGKSKLTKDGKITELGPVLKKAEEWEKVKDMMDLEEVSVITGMYGEAILDRRRKGVLPEDGRYTNKYFWKKEKVEAFMRTENYKKYMLKRSRIEEAGKKRKNDDKFGKPFPRMKKENITVNAYIRLGGAVIKDAIREYKAKVKENGNVKQIEDWIRCGAVEFYSMGKIQPEYVIRMCRK